MRKYKAECKNDSKTVFLPAHINILPNSQSLELNCQKHSHCTFASRINGSTPIQFLDYDLSKFY